MLKYLWSNRRRFPIGSAQWWKYWAKRFATGPRLCQSCLFQSVLRLRGAEIENPAFIARCKLNGTARNLKVGGGTFIGRVTLHLHDRIEIGKNVVVNDGAVILTASHDVASPKFETTKAPVVIRDYAWIATGAVLLPGTEIEGGAVIGAGAVVKGRVPEFKIMVGNPAKALKRERARQLHYNPVRKVAALEAWLGPELT